MECVSTFPLFRTSFPLTLGPAVAYLDFSTTQIPCHGWDFETPGPHVAVLTFSVTVFRDGDPHKKLGQRSSSNQHSLERISILMSITRGLAVCLSLSHESIYLRQPSGRHKVGPYESVPVLTLSMSHFQRLQTIRRYYSLARTSKFVISLRQHGLINKFMSPGIFALNLYMDQMTP